MKTIIDYVAAHELVLYATNDSRLYHRHSLPIIANLAKKMRKGQYDPEKAAKLWLYMIDEAAKQYCFEFCDKHTKYYTIFNAATRKSAAEIVEYEYREMVEYEVKEAANND